MKYIHLTHLHVVYIFPKSDNKQENSLRCSLSVTFPPLDSHTVVTVS